MRGVLVAVVLVASSLGSWACGANSYGGGSSGNPSTPTPPSTSNVVTVSVVGINGALSFSPNPATLPAGQMIVWHNVDTTTHRVVFNDRSVDTGNLDPGTYSQPQAVPPVGGYHCSIHPVMVGSINQDTQVPAACTGAYCD